jgi:hypothetical protein
MRLKWEYTDSQLEEVHLEKRETGVRSQESGG